LQFLELRLQNIFAKKVQFFVVSKVVVHVTAILGTKCASYLRISIYYASLFMRDLLTRLFSVVWMILNDAMCAVKLLCQQHANKGMGQSEF
jgi:hypothetical protein